MIDHIVNNAGVLELELQIAFPNSYIRVSRFSISGETKFDVVLTVRYFSCCRLMQAQKVWTIK